MFRKCFNSYPRKFEGCFRIVSKLFQRSLRWYFKGFKFLKGKVKIKSLCIFKMSGFQFLKHPYFRDSSSNVNATAKRRLANDNFDHFLSIFKFFSPFLAFLAIYVFNHLSPFRTLKILKFNLLILNNSKFSQSLKKIGNDDEGLVDFSRGATYMSTQHLSHCQKKSYPPPPQRNIALSRRLLYKAPSYVNATFLCRVAKIVHTPLNETSPCRVDLSTKRHHMSTRHFFVALPKNSYPPSKKHCFVS